jgi:hypothetical protein
MVAMKQRSLWDDHPAPETGRPSVDDAAALQIAYERRILHGLSAEWENGTWLLPDELRRSLKKPLFRLIDSTGCLGSWDSAKREIRINRQLAVNGRWDDLKEVLLHEMAHQVAHEGLRAISETAHGKGFRRACRMLRANPASSGNHLPLHERLRRGEQLGAEDRMVMRIQKLMALAESSNPNEAHAAMRKAYELIALHNVQLIDRGIKQAYVSIFLGTPRLRHFREAYHLAHLLQAFYFVQGIWIQAWVMDKRRMGRVLEISGSFKNVSIAEYVYAAINRYIDTAWEAYRRGKRLNRYRKTDFAVGIIEGFRSTLEQASAAKENSPALPACIEDTALTRYVVRRYPHIRSFSRQGPDHDGQVLADGTEKGRQLVIAKGISHSDGYQERVIEHKEHRFDSEI